MDGQMSMFPGMEQKKVDEKAKKGWERSFQKWSNKNCMDMENTTSCGCCGFGSMCDYCIIGVHGSRPCVRSLNKMCRRKGIEIEYTNRTEEYFENVWYGCFERKET